MASAPTPPPLLRSPGDGSSGKLVRLSLTKVDSKGKALTPARKFAAMLNPQAFQHTQTITYIGNQPAGSTGSRNDFNKMPPGKASCELMIDGTGAVPLAALENRPEVDQQIEALRAVVYKFVGLKHEPGHVKLIWGSLIMFVRLTSLTVNYTLFKPDGKPLRATVNLAFTEFINYRDAKAEAALSSPDLSHSVLVRDGDTLPLLCQRIYGDPDYYLAVARYNGLQDVRALQPGARLKFPRLV